MKDFLKTKFDMLVVGFIFLNVFYVWVYFEFQPEVKDFLIGLFGAFLAMLGLRPRPNVVADSIQAENIESANTQTGDVFVHSDSKITKKGDLE